MRWPADLYGYLMGGGWGVMARFVQITDGWRLWCDGQQICMGGGWGVMARRFVQVTDGWRLGCDGQQICMGGGWGAMASRFVRVTGCKIPTSQLAQD